MQEVQNISDLIARLQKFKDELGDVKVMVILAGVCCPVLGPVKVQDKEPFVALIPDPRKAGV